MSSIAFQIPGKISVKQADEFHGIFTFKPLERGYGVTIGNALRRVILSSLEGYAITSIRIPGIYHEFSTIEGVTEDLVEIILNLKQIRFKKIGDTTENKIFISINNKKILTAGDFAQATAAFEITNPELVICHIDESARFEIEVTVEKGRGYVPAEENKIDAQVKGVIPIDSIFTPVKNVKYHVENTRVGQKTDYESLVFSVETDGTIHPQTAIERAADIMIKHFALLIDRNKMVETKDADEIDVLDESTLQMRKLLKTPLSEMGLSVRAFNCLKAADIKTLGDLVQLKVSDMAQFRNFGKKSLKELQDLVASKDLTFGMDLSAYNLNDQ
ncbi:DNA-directed RNA polymerase, alpha subunit [Candidatus Amoebophilus asiaticus 5a2]|uniref:DNA-directed RNA polymerase subunit alpha n=1 Tax=Amoebophilus asiaticus (strain 5a2) TaxID=452471 RepID=B3EUJ6_AMOA5|nr:DNA-directed RNA polymerase subunit alpha [Candidatus Amoebophilus asiaticus]ACE05615.1 DNA-directed RNA polymerase, alpha subunit [Candidatus Amoebophilus asiaticus 5a2]